MQKAARVFIVLILLGLAATGCGRTSHPPSPLTSPTGAKAPVFSHDKAGDDFLSMLQQLNEAPGFTTNDVLGPSPSPSSTPGNAFEALNEGQGHLVGDMLKKDPSLVHATDSGGRTLLHYARSAMQVDALIQRGANINARDLQGNTPLFFMAARGDAGVVAEAVARGADVNTANDRAMTPLHVASGAGHRDVVGELLKDGAHVDARTRDGATPLMMAVGGGTQDCAELLIYSRADVNAHDGRGNTALHISIASLPDNDSWCNWLADKGADINAQNDAGNTPLHICVLTDGGKAASALIRRGARLDLRNRSGLTPLELAQRLGDSYMVAICQGQSPEPGLAPATPQGRGQSPGTPPASAGSSTPAPAPQGHGQSPGTQSTPAAR